MMKTKYILGLSLILAAFTACEKESLTDVDKMLGEKFNQEALWDMDSLAFHRATWTTQDVAEGIQMMESQIKMWDSKQSIAYVSYSPDEFKTYVAYTGENGTVSELAEKNENALFAFNAMSSTSDYFKYKGSVVNAQTASPEQTSGVIAIPSSSASNLVNFYNCPDGNYTSVSEDIAMATGPVLLVDGEEQTFPAGTYFDTRMARTIMGYNASTGNYTFAVINKGAAGEADGATMAEAAYVARMMGLSAAVCLSSGDDTSLWSKDDGVISGTDSKKVATVIYVGANVPELEGLGTADSPYLIDMPVKMKQMRKYATPGQATYFKLMVDLDMASVKTWFPVNHDDPYDRQVHFDGNGKTISNFAPTAFVDNVNTSKNTNYNSIFGVLYGSCKDLTIKNSKISGRQSVGFLGGYVGTTGKPATVENVHIVNCELTATENANSYCGAFGGQSREATYKNCSAKIKLTAAGTDCGGFVGLGNISLSFENCTVDATLTTSVNVGSNLRYGGLAGYVQGTSLTVKNCSATGSITYAPATVNCASGLIAYCAAQTCTITNSTSSVTMPSGKTSNSAGIIGTVGGAAKNCTITNCSSTGDMSVHQTSGGIVGRHEAGVLTINNCFMSGSIEGYSGLGSIIGQSKSGLTMKMSNCIAWSPSIKATRDASDKYSSGAIGGSISGTNTVTGCVRRGDMEFSDPYRSIQTHGDLSAATPAGEANQHAYDGAPTSATTISEAAKAAGWDETVWDLSGETPTLKTLK